MRKRRTVRTAGAALAAVAVAGLIAAPAAARTDDAQRARIALATKAPYEGGARPAEYERPPAGFVPAFTENVSRHGSRTLSDSDDGDALLTLWQTARAENGLTRRGRGLGKDVTALLAANAEIGYGLLTQEGRDELSTTARNLERRLPQLFHAAHVRPDGTTPTRIEVLASSQARTVDSAHVFVDALLANHPKLAPAIAALVTDDALLYFHKSDAAYQDYVKNDPRLAEVEGAVRDDPRTDVAARTILRRSFTPAFIDEIAAGEHADQFADVVAAAEAVYDMWAVTADMPTAADGAPAGGWDLDRYLTPGSAAWFGYLDDVESFYENGPGFAGDTITYSMAHGLLDSMFAALDAKRDGTSTLSAVLRFTHAEEVFPLAALLQLPGSAQQQPVGTPFTYADNPFRGAQVAPMAANIQWDLYRDGDRYLVRMLYNEKQTPFKAGCHPVAGSKYFYDLDELESCYGYAAAGAAR